jgi:hypothetical protein
VKSRRKNSSFIFGVVSLFLLMVFLFGMVGGVSAEGTVANVTINAGTLHFEDHPESVAFAPIDLATFINVNKGVGTFFTNLSDFTVVDSRGSGEGWTVSVSATNLSKTGGVTIETGSLSLKRPSKLTQDYTGTSNTTPGIFPVVGEWVPIDGTGPQNLITAIADNGLGRWTINWGAISPTEALQLKLDAGTIKAGIYSSTITWSLIAPVNIL